ncbi:MAG: hypothetical protein ACREDY_25050 [Bradyrhizobium sp.]
MRTRNIVAGAAAFAIAGAVIAQEKADFSGGIEQRLDRIEQAIAGLGAKLGASGHGGMKEGCRNMTGSGRMMGGGMMSGQGKGGSPNDQWRRPSAR